jgi:hypothetical protein
MLTPRRGFQQRKGARRMVTVKTLMVSVCCGVMLLSAVSTHAGLTSNGLALNGLTSNGVLLNGLHLNGLSLNGLATNGLTSNGGRTSEMPSEGIALNGLSQRGLGKTDPSPESPAYDRKTPPICVMCPKCCPKD